MKLTALFLALTLAACSDDYPIFPVTVKTAETNCATHGGYKSFTIVTYGNSDAHVVSELVEVNCNDGVAVKQMVKVP